MSFARLPAKGGLFFLSLFDAVSGADGKTDVARVKNDRGRIRASSLGRFAQATKGTRNAPVGYGALGD